ncbi:MAG: cytochrome d ubiquinol oxidase subunit I [Myxococcota bacterium]|jgi:cytochrome d ubiquinol oxidase subunit I
MSDLLAARSQMAMSLGFHILFAVVGIGMPLLMVMAERKFIKTGDPIFLDLAKRWSRGTAIVFAVGAVSGTMLSFELGLLWPEFMRWAGPVIGMPFSLEGFAFFLEAIFLGIYLYGWDKLSPRKHLWSGIGVMLCGVLSGIFVITANAWMNAPTGFDMVDGVVTAIRPFEAMMGPAAFTQTLHMTVASFAAIGFLTAGIHAAVLRRKPNSRFHLEAYKIALFVGAVASVPVAISGDLSAKHIAEYQPIKLAAAEGHWETSKGAAFRIFGFPDEDTETTPGSIEIPGLLSFLAHGDFDAEVIGLKSVPPEDRPPVAIVHWAFQIMVGCGSLMIAVGLFGLFVWWRRKKPPTSRIYLRIMTLCAPLGFIAIEAGWTVTEVGRQPWIVHGIMRTKDAVTPMPGLVVPFLVVSALYLMLGIMVIVLLRRHVFSSPDADG